MTMDEMKTHYETLLDALTNEMQAMRKELQECKEKLSQDQCEDFISRQAVHEAIEKWAGSMDVLTALPTRYIRPLFDSIHKLPPVTPMLNMGQWIKTDEGFSPYKCSVCGSIEFKESNYCPNCGAKMGGAE